MLPYCDPVFENRRILNANINDIRRLSWSDPKYSDTDNAAKESAQALASIKSDPEYGHK